MRLHNEMKTWCFYLWNELWVFFTRNQRLNLSHNWNAFWRFFISQIFQDICLENKLGQQEKDLKHWIETLHLGRMQQGNNRWAKEFVNLSLGQWFKPPRVKNIVQTTFAFKTNKDLNRPERSTFIDYFLPLFLFFWMPR